MSELEGVPVKALIQRKRLQLVLLSCLVAGAPAASGHALTAPASDPSFDCRLIAFSPAFQSDRTAFCAGLDINIVRRSIQASFFVSEDAGQTWHRAEANGLTTATTSRPEQLIVSPMFETDRAVFLHTDEGIWKTTDLGESFTLVDPLANPGVGRLAPLVETIVGERVVFAFANAELTAKIDPPLHVPVAGAPEPEIRFVIPDAFGEDSTRMVVTRHDADEPVIVLFSCNVAFVCTERLFEFPPGLEFGNIWLGPPADAERAVFVETLRSVEPGVRQPVLWRSNDGGRTFVEWRSVNRFVEPIAEAGGRAARVGLAREPGRPSRLFLRISYWPRVAGRATRSNPPGEQIFVSNDLGQTWRRIAYGLSFKQTGRPGSIPWNHVNQQSEAYLGFAGDGYLFALGEVFAAPPDGYTGPFCSHDGGRTWSRSCS